MTYCTFSTEFAPSTNGTDCPTWVGTGNFWIICLPESALFSKTLTRTLSIIYGVFLLTAGMVIVLTEQLLPTSFRASSKILKENISEIVDIVLMAIGIAWFVYLHLDITSYLKNQWFNRDSTEAVRGNEPYTFLIGRHSGSFFLKIGAVVFCLVHVINSLIIFTHEVMMYTSSADAIREKCGNLPALLSETIRPLYSLYQLFILFKYSSVVIKKREGLARFSVMHCMATSLYFWFSMVITETAHKVEEDVGESSGNFTLHTYVECGNADPFAKTVKELTPYLYPFSIEYSILVVGVWYMMWRKIGGEEKEHMSTDVLDLEASGDSASDQYIASPEGGHSRLTACTNCHASNRGLSLGVLQLSLVLAVTTAGIALQDSDLFELCNQAKSCIELAVTCTMIIAVCFGYTKLSRLSIDPFPISQLDDFLLLVCLPCFFTYTIFSLPPAIYEGNVVHVVVVFFELVQVVLQTLMIIDGLRRCSNNPILVRKKPGREFIAFLIVSNITLWILNTFATSDFSNAFEALYGEENNTLMVSVTYVTLPLTLFYRFHSSVCLTDIWKSGYAPGHL